MSNSVSTFFFPLRTNVQYFDTPEGFLYLKGRIKQTLILYDRVIFESGLYIATMGPDAAAGMYLPPAQLPAREDLEAFDRIRSESISFSLSVQTDRAKPFHPWSSSSVERQFSSSFHPLFDELTSEVDIDGLGIVDVRLSEDGKQQADLLASEYLKTEGAILPEGSPRVQRHIVQDFFRDLVLISTLGCAGSMDPLHAPMLDHVACGTTGLRAAPGFAALEFQVPHVAALPWEQIAEVRTHPAIVEYRRRLFEAEKTVRNMLPEASEGDIRRELGHILYRDLVREVEARTAASGWKLVGNVTYHILSGLISFVPFVGNIVDIGETVFSVGKEIADSYKESRTWLAVLMKLSRID